MQLWTFLKFVLLFLHLVHSLTLFLSWSLFFISSVAYNASAFPSHWQHFLVCVCVYVHACVCLGVYVCSRGQSQVSRCHYSEIVHFVFLRQSFSLAWDIFFGWPVNESQGSSWFCSPTPPVLELCRCDIMPGFFSSRVFFYLNKAVTLLLILQYYLYLLRLLSSFDTTEC